MALIILQPCIRTFWAPFLFHCRSWSDHGTDSGSDVFWMGAYLGMDFIGAILVGGVHDFGSTLMSMRSEGRSIADTMD